MSGAVVPGSKSQDLQGIWDHSPSSYHRDPILALFFPFTTTLCITFIPNF